jgi:gliding motility-associated-like protein
MRRFTDIFQQLLMKPPDISLLSFLENEVNIASGTFNLFQTLLLVSLHFILLTASFFSLQQLDFQHHIPLFKQSNDLKNVVDPLSIRVFPAEKGFISVGCDSLAVQFQTELACPFANDGKIVATPTGGTEPYTFTWETGTSTTKELTGIDVGTYSVTVTDAIGCVLVDSVVLGAATRPVVSTKVEDVRCFGINDGRLTIIANDPSLQFKLGDSPVSSQKVYENLWSGGDQFFVIDTFGCVWENFFTIESPDEILLELPGNYISKMCDSVEIEVNSNVSPLTYSWSPSYRISCTDCPNPIVQPITTTTYTLTAKDSNGCTATGDVQIEVIFDGNAYIPNAFSPNSDNLNDVFYVLGGCVSEVVSMQIYNRWGEKVFETNNAPPKNATFGWDGKFKGEDVNSDIFAYHITVQFYDGTVKTYKGDLTLLR